MAREFARTKRKGLPEHVSDKEKSMLALVDPLFDSIFKADKMGVAGWPLVPSKRFPKEQTLACPKCKSTDVTLTGAHGPGGRLGDPGSTNIIRCESCKHQQVYKSLTRATDTHEQVMHYVTNMKVRRYCPECGKTHVPAEDANRARIHGMFKRPRGTGNTGNKSLASQVEDLFKARGPETDSTRAHRLAHENGWQEWGRAHPNTGGTETVYENSKHPGHILWIDRGTGRWRHTHVVEGRTPAGGRTVATSPSVNDLQMHLATFGRAQGNKSFGEDDLEKAAGVSQKQRHAHAYRRLTGWARALQAKGINAKYKNGALTVEHGGKTHNFQYRWITASSGEAAGLLHHNGQRADKTPLEMFGAGKSFIDDSDLMKAHITNDDLEKAGTHWCSNCKARVSVRKDIRGPFCSKCQSRTVDKLSSKSFGADDLEKTLNRRHFARVASEIAQIENTDERAAVTRHFENMFANANPQFNRQRFRAASSGQPSNWRDRPDRQRQTKTGTQLSQRGGVMPYQGGGAPEFVQKVNEHIRRIHSGGEGPRVRGAGPRSVGLARSESSIEKARTRMPKVTPKNPAHASLWHRIGRAFERFDKKYVRDFDRSLGGASMIDDPIFDRIFKGAGYPSISGAKPRGIKKMPKVTPTNPAHASLWSKVHQAFQTGASAWDRFDRTHPEG